MIVPAKYLFYDSLPNAKDVDKLMADNGYATPPRKKYSQLGPDVSNYAPPDDMTVHITPPGWGREGRGEVNPSQYRNDQSGLSPVPTGSPQQNVADNYGQVTGSPLSLDFNKPPQPPINNPNGLSDYIATGIGIADSLIPGERIHKNYPTQPLPVYSPYQYGTGSQAIMEHGGNIDYGYEHDFAGEPMLAKDGHWIQHAINPAHKGYCTPMTKSTCTGHRKAFAMRAKHHNLENGGPMNYYDDGGVMLTEKAFLSDLTPQKLELDDPTGDLLKTQKALFADLPGGTANSGIHIKPSHKGRFTAYKKRTGQTTEEALHSKDPHVRQMANFARNAKKWHHEDGGELPIYDGGGSLTSDKAKEILRDGTAQGHKLTSKQKRYFGWVAGGSKAPSGTVLPNLGSGEKSTLPYTPQSRTDAYLVDDINSVLKSGQRTQNTGYAPEQQQLLTDAYVWKQKNPHVGLNDSIQGYFNQPVDPNNPMSVQRGRLSKIGYGPLSMYNTTPNSGVRMVDGGHIKSDGYGPKAMFNSPPTKKDKKTAIAKQAVKVAQQPVLQLPPTEDGGYLEGSIHDLSEEQIAHMLKKGYRFEHFKD